MLPRTLVDCGVVATEMLPARVKAGRDKLTAANRVKKKAGRLNFVICFITDLYIAIWSKRKEHE